MNALAPLRRPFPSAVVLCLSLLVACGGETAETPPTTQAPRAEVPGGIVEAYCLRSMGQDLVFALDTGGAGGPDKPRGATDVFRAPLGPDGPTEPIEPLFSLEGRYGPDEARIDAVHCRADGDDLLVVVGNASRMDDDEQWWSEVWWLDADGVPVLDRALARDLGANRLAWSPDGRRVLIEASPMDDAGAVHVLDLDTGGTTRLDGVATWTVAGSGNGWLHWAGEGDVAVAESMDLSPAGSLGRTYQAVGITPSGPGSRREARVDGALASAVGPDGALYVVGRDPGGSGAGLRVLRWDVAAPGAEPEAIGRVVLETDEGPEWLVDALAVLPAGTSMPRLLAVLDPGRSGALYAVSPDAEGDWRAARISAPGVDVADVQAGGEIAVYRIDVPVADRDAVAGRPLDLRQQLRALSLDATE